MGRLVDHAHVTRRDKAMIKTKAGTETDEHLVTSAMIERACELEGEAGYPISLSEPNVARNSQWRGMVFNGQSLGAEAFLGRVSGAPWWPKVRTVRMRSRARSRLMRATSSQAAASGQ